MRAHQQSFKVRLLLEVAPWRLLLPLQNLRMSREEILVLYPHPDEIKDDWGVQFCENMAEGHSFRLHIEHEEGFCSQPFIGADLTERRLTTLGWELCFRFHEPIAL